VQPIRELVRGCMVWLRQLSPPKKGTPMIRGRSLVRFVAGAAVVPLIALALAGCGSSNKANASARPVASNGQPATVGVANSGLGKVLVDAQGRTLYLFQKDSGTTSACTGACATFWPPLTATGTPTAGSGAKASLVATTMRPDGKSQVVYNGHPVYLYTGDHKAGDTTGQGLVAFGGGWFALSAAGDQVAGPAPSSSGGNGY
jgi:predicted lipoprotein with Yx(FWY)xxD motif